MPCFFDDEQFAPATAHECDVRQTIATEVICRVVTVVTLPAARGVVDAAAAAVGAVGGVRVLVQVPWREGWPPHTQLIYSSSIACRLTFFDEAFSVLQF